jgi:Rrf2 family protein
MKLGTRARYSLRLMAEVARFSVDDAPVHLSDVALWSGISRRYLEQLAIPLKNAGLLKGRPGRGGGFALGRDAADIRLLDVIEAAAGRVAVTECAITPHTCSRADRCECLPLWSLVTHRIREVLGEYSLADMLDPLWNGRMRALIRATGRGKEAR